MTSSPTTDTPIAYLELPWLEVALALAPRHQRKTMTELRRALPHEVGMDWETLVADGTGLRLEMVATVTADSIIARNPQALGTGPTGEVYNSWLIAPDVVDKHYGSEVLAGLDHTFQTHRRLGHVRALPLTHSLMAELKVAGEELLIAVPWSTTPMRARVGDFLTDQGYSVSTQEMRNSYASMGR